MASTPDDITGVVGSTIGVVARDKDPSYNPLPLFIPTLQETPYVKLRRKISIDVLHYD